MRALVVIITALVLALGSSAQFTSIPQVFQERWFMPSGGCSGSTGGNAWDYPAAAAPDTAACAGTSYQRGIVPFSNSADASATFSVVLPERWSGNIDINVVGSANATSASFQLDISTICIAASEDILNPTFNTVQSVVQVSPGTANQRFLFTQTALTVTGCAVNEELIIKVKREIDDTATATLNITGAYLDVRHQ